jgi:hypothetical protein
MISRTTLDVYDRRDVHTRSLVEELALQGLSVDEVSKWLENLDTESPSAEEIHRLTGGHPLAMELLELYGNVTHGDWLKFLDEEIIRYMPEEEFELLATLAVSDKPIPWGVLAKSVNWDGNPPQRLLEYGLLLDLEEGMWLHEALRERFLREVGSTQSERKKKLAD